MSLSQTVEMDGIFYEAGAVYVVSLHGAVGPFRTKEEAEEWRRAVYYTIRRAVWRVCNSEGCSMDGGVKRVHGIAALLGEDPGSVAVLLAVVKLTEESK